MFPHSHFAYALLCGYLFVAASVGESEVENTKFLMG